MPGSAATAIRHSSCSTQRGLVSCKQWQRHVGIAAGSVGAGTASGSPFTDLMQAIQAQLQQQAPDNEPPSTEINVQNLCYHPAGISLSPRRVLQIEDFWQIGILSEMLKEL